MTTRTNHLIRLRRNPGTDQQHAIAQHSVALRNLIRQHDVGTFRRSHIYHDTPIFNVVQGSNTRNRFFQTYEIASNYPFISLSDYLFYVRSTMIRYARWLFDQNGMYKLSVRVVATYINPSRSDLPFEGPHQVSGTAIFTRDMIPQVIDEMFRELNNQGNDMTGNGSGLTFAGIKDTLFYYSHYHPSNGIMSHAYQYIPLPKWIADKKACINPQNSDLKCFMYCLELAYMNFNGVQDLRGERVHKRKQTNNFNFDGITYTLEEQSVFQACTLFEKKNPGVSLNVLMPSSYQQFEIIYKSKNKGNIPCDLLYFSDAKEEQWHYAYIRNFDRLLNNRKDFAHAFHCRNCLVGFYSRDRLETHQTLFECTQREASTVVLPDPKRAYYFFNNLKARVKRQNVIYADFECFIQKIHKPSNEGSGVYLHQHRPCSYGLRVVSQFSQFDNVMIQRRLTKEEEAFDLYYLSRQFIYQIQALVHDMKRVYMIEEHWNRLGVPTHNSIEDVTHCWLCGLPFKGGRRRAWDNRGLQPFEMEQLYKTNDDKWTHQLCFDSIRDCTYGPQEFEVPVVFHNLKGYDGHIILKSIDHSIEKISCIPQDGEAFLTFTLDNASFIDSLRFLNSSLADISAVLLKDCFKKEKLNEEVLRKKFKYSHQWFFEYCMKKGLEPDSELFLKIVKKGIYPYEYMQNVDCFDEEQLPIISDFHSTLTGSDITQEQYGEAQTIWKAYEIENLGEWHDLYLAIDVNLLADVFENFRDVIYNDSGLDAVRYVSTPGLSKDMLLKQKGYVQKPETTLYYPFEIELINKYNVDLYYLCDTAIRGGITLISKRYAKANKKTKIVDIDANNLYGWAMCQPLPSSNYKFISTDMLFNFTPEFILSVPDDAQTGYFITVDLHFPKEIHDKLKDYPLAPVKQVVDEEQISDYSRDILDCTDTKHDDKSDKLLCTLEDRIKYTVHYRLLKLYLKLGVQITQVHNVMSFYQTAWMKDYVVDQSTKRKNANSELERDVHKLNVNAGYGKTVQDNTKFKTVKFATKDADMKKYVRSPYFDQQEVINDDCVMINLRKGKVTLDKPVMVGASILELSKLHMYEFYHLKLKPKFKDNIHLLMTDTDSLVLEIKTENFYNDLKKFNLLDEFDFSKYPKDHPQYNSVNDKVLGKFKLEFMEDDIIEFVGLKPKCYSLLLKSGEQEKRAKGVCKEVMEKESMKHQAYRDCLKIDTYEPNIETMHGIRSKNQVLYTEEYHKKTLSPNDTKIYIMPDGIHTLPYGHYLIEQMKQPVIFHNASET